MNQVRQGPAVIAPRDWLHLNDLRAGVLVHSQMEKKKKSAPELSLEDKGANVSTIYCICIKLMLMYMSNIVKDCALP